MRKKKVQTIGTWLSFADKSKPRGQQAFGCIIVDVEGNNEAVTKVLELGLWPHLGTTYEECMKLDVAMWPVELKNYKPEDLNRMLSVEESLRIGDPVTVTYCADCGGFLDIKGPVQ
jgi:hypothetical protein